MKTIIARNVNDALKQGIKLIKLNGEEVDSRVGKTLEIPCPVATVYQSPWERVLLNKERDANPFFHLMESIWILAGRKDVKFLSEFNKRIADYSDNGRTFNAAYGYRLRNSTGTVNSDKDQLLQVIEILKKDPTSRQAVAQIWDQEDLSNNTKDKACNMSIVFRIRNQELCMTVYNRSNDMVWGAYGANAVQFSMIQEYVAAKLNLPMGEYTQITNSYHVYTEGAGGIVWDRIKDQLETCENPYIKCPNLVLLCHDEMLDFEHDLNMFFNIYDNESWGLPEIGELSCWRSEYFKHLVIPVLCVYLIHKKYGAEEAMSYINSIYADDWRTACNDWLSTRITNQEAKQNTINK